MNKSNTIIRALISVADKTGLIELATELKQLNIDIISTGGTFSALQKANIPATEVSDITNFPEILAGRVKTLHPNIHAGILSRREEDAATLQAHNIETIDLVIVNLYQFVKAVTSSENPAASNTSNAIEHIDIGGPSMIRAGAKNCQYVTVITDPNDYPQLINLLQSSESITLPWREHFAAKAFAHTAAYDAAIAEYFKPKLQATANEADFGEFFTPSLIRQTTLRYGENPHQQAALYCDTLKSNPKKPTLANTLPIQGKPLSFNNLADANAAYEAVQNLTPCGCSIVKHANPCGLAQASTPLAAYEKAFEADKTSAFGGIIAFNHPLDEATCQKIINNQFLEVLIAPDISAAGKAVLQSKPNIRVLCLPKQTHEQQPDWTCQRINGGMLVQSADNAPASKEQMKVATDQEPTAEQWDDLLFAWNAVKFVKSNAIVIAKAGATLGIGAGQMSRSFSVEIAGRKAKEGELSLENSVLASDGFFPFKDSIEIAAKLGVTAIIQPGGSIRDDEVIECANRLGITMVFTGKRHFLH